MSRGTNLGSYKVSQNNKGQLVFTKLPVKKLSSWVLCGVLLLFTPFGFYSMLTLIGIILIVFYVKKNKGYLSKSNPVLAAQTVFSQGTCGTVACNRCYHNYWQYLTKSCPYKTLEGKEPTVENGGMDLCSAKKIEQYLVAKEKLLKVK